MKKIWVGIVCVTLFFVVIFILFSGSVDTLIEITTIERKAFELTYKTKGIVESDEEKQFFEGTIISIQKDINNYVEKNEVILTYKDFNNKTRTINAKKAGFVEFIDGSCVSVKSDDFYISCYLPYDKFKCLKLEEVCCYEVGDRVFTGQISYLAKMAMDDLYEVRLKIEENDLLLYQKVIVKFPINHLLGAVVDKRALLKLDGKYYVVKESYKKDLNNYKDYLVEVMVQYENEKEVLISGVGIENMNVCIITEALKEVIFND